METTKTLKAARELIYQPETWCQDKLYKSNGKTYQRCAMGALNFAATGLGRYPLFIPDRLKQATLKLAESFKRLFGIVGDRKKGDVYSPTCHRYTEWDVATSVVAEGNNSLTHAEVILAFDVAIGEPHENAIHEPSAQERAELVGS